MPCRRRYCWYITWTAIIDVVHWPCQQADWGDLIDVAYLRQHSVGDILLVLQAVLIIVLEPWLVLIVGWELPCLFFFHLPSSGWEAPAATACWCICKRKHFHEQGGGVEVVIAMVKVDLLCTPHLRFALGVTCQCLLSEAWHKLFLRDLLVLQESDICQHDQPASTKSQVSCIMCNR